MVRTDPNAQQSRRSEVNAREYRIAVRDDALAAFYARSWSDCSLKSPWLNLLRRGPWAGVALASHGAQRPRRVKYFRLDEPFREYDVRLTLSPIDTDSRTVPTSV